ncbi:MAG: hypothetical protein JW993_18110 [Sedimentisphaerales bacterium]|nr:hypothetical protein [Sedimentisphaerales bacterium]
MRTVKVSDELFEQLKGLVVDPFDDTPDIVISRLIDIVNKAKSRWSPLDAYDAAEGTQAPHRPQRHAPQVQPEEEEQVVVL